MVPKRKNNGHLVQRSSFNFHSLFTLPGQEPALQYSLASV